MVNLHLKLFSDRVCMYLQLDVHLCLLLVCFFILQETALEIVKAKMESKLQKQPDIQGFIIEGFPRSTEQAQAFMAQVMQTD